MILSTCAQPYFSANDEITRQMKVHKIHMAYDRWLKSNDWSRNCSQDAPCLLRGGAGVFYAAPNRSDIDRERSSHQQTRGLTGAARFFTFCHFVTSSKFKRKGEKRYSSITVTGKCASLLSTDEGHCGKAGLFMVGSPPPGVQTWSSWGLCWDGV